MTHLGRKRTQPSALFLADTTEIVRFGPGTGGTIRVNGAVHSQADGRGQNTRRALRGKIKNDEPLHSACRSELQSALKSTVKQLINCGSLENTCIFNKSKQFH